MTSCDRWDLFQQTLDSFFKLNTYPYVAFYVHNDSIQPIPQQIKEKYADKGITWHEGTKRGLSTAWDYLIALVETEYFFNLEDDWLFEGNPYFIQMCIFELSRFNIDQIWVRNEKDHNHPLIPAFKEFKKVGKTKDWCGFSFNPSMRTLSRWLELFPNGIAGKDEIEISREVHDVYLAASLVDSACRHIGNGRHTKDFKI
jgi:hypothetical protein